MPRTINLNTIARRVSIAEGGAESLSIAQIKEVIRLYNEQLSTYSDGAVIDLMERTRCNARALTVKGAGK